MKFLFNLVVSALCVFALQVGHSVQGADPDKAPASSNKPQRDLTKLVNQFCINCHSSEDANADLNFETLLEPEGFARDRELWEASIEQIIQENMPPEGEMPPEATRKRMVDLIRSGIKNVDWDAVASPGDVPLPRLTSLEYANTLQDVVGLPIPFDDLLPVDLQGNSGFANDRAALTMGEVEMRGFLLAAERAARAAVATSEAENSGSVASEFVFESESGRFKTHWERDAKPFQYGGATVVEFDRWWGMKDQKLFHMVTIEHPGLYRFTARAANNLAGDQERNYMRPFLKGPNKEAYSAARGALAFTVNGSAIDQSSGVVVTSDELRDHVTYVYLDEGPHEIGINYEFLRVPYVELPPEKPKIPVPNEQFTRGDGFVRVPKGAYRSIGLKDLEDLNPGPFDEKKVAKLLQNLNSKSLAVYRRHYRPAVYYQHSYVADWVQFPGKVEGEVNQMIAQLAKLLELPKETVNQFWSSRLGGEFVQVRENGRKYFQYAKQVHGEHVRTYASVVLDRVTIAGPVTPPGAEGVDAALSLALAKADEKSIASWLDQLLTRVLGRTPTAAERERYLGFLQERREAGQSPSDAIAETMLAVLVSPKVIYRSQPMDAPIAALNVGALDARLAALLWTGSPLTQAPAGLADSEKAIIKRVDEMIADSRFDRFADVFTRQWLRLDRIGREVIPVEDIYPDFSQHLADDMREECAKIVARVFRENLPLTALIDDDQTFLNERLVRHYGMHEVNVKGDALKLQKVDRRHAGGLLGTGGLMTATSSGVRPGPVQRGIVVAESLLGERFGSPPPNVDSLPADAGNSKQRSLREELAIHRENPSCATCHDRIDPYGFALDSFDLVGRRRTVGPAGPIDDTTVAPDGTELRGLEGLKRYITEERQEDFVRNLTERMLAFALGRELSYRDEAAVRSIVKQIEANDLSARTLLRGIALSAPFRERDTTLTLESSPASGTKQ